MVAATTASASMALATAGYASATATAAKVDRRPVPILMYHVIAKPPASAPFPDLYVPPAELRAQVRWQRRALAVSS